MSHYHSNVRDILFNLFEANDLPAASVRVTFRPAVPDESGIVREASPGGA